MPCQDAEAMHARKVTRGSMMINLSGGGGAGATNCKQPKISQVLSFMSGCDLHKLHSW